MNRLKKAINQLSIKGLLGLGIICMLTTWLFVFLQALNYAREAGTIQVLSHHLDLFLSLFEPSFFIFSVIVVVLAGIVPMIILLVNPNSPKTTKVAYAVWAVSIVELLYIIRIFG